MAKKKKSAKKRKTGKAAGEEALTSLQDLVNMDDSDWADTPAAEGGGIPFPAGRGQTARIESADVTSSQANNPMIKWVLKGTCEANEGQTDFENSMLITAQNRSFARRQIEAIGLEWPATAAELGETVKEAEGLEISCDVVDKDDFHNIYFTDVVGGTEEAADEGEEGYTKADIKALGKGADAGDEEAITALEEIIEADALGIDPDDYETWKDLAGAIMEALEL